MKKLPPACALLFLSCLTASAQQGGPGYRFDNFDAHAAGHVEVVEAVGAGAGLPREGGQGGEEEQDEDGGKFSHDLACSK